MFTHATAATNGIAPGRLAGRAAGAADDDDDDDRRLFSGDGTVLDMRGMQRASVFPNVPESWLHRVEQLQASKNQLELLPAEFGVKFGSLVRLDVSRNQLTELSGCSIEELISLQHLDVAWNQLKGLPEAVCALPSLKELHASHNRLEYIPAAIGQLKELSELQLSHNSITSVPQEMAQLVQLTTCNLLCNPIPAEHEEELPSNIRILYQKDKLAINKPDRRLSVQRALHIRASVRRRVLENIMAEAEQHQQELAEAATLQQQQQQQRRASVSASKKTRKKPTQLRLNQTTRL